MERAGFITNNVTIPGNVKAHMNICQEINTLYRQKNNDYGGAIQKGVNELGWIYLTAQLYNKFQRFQNLTGGAQSLVKDEKIEDTLLDMANYAIEGVRILRSRQPDETVVMHDGNGDVLGEL